MNYVTYEEIDAAYRQAWVLPHGHRITKLADLIAETVYKRHYNGVAWKLVSLVNHVTGGAINSVHPSVADMKAAADKASAATVDAAAAEVKCLKGIVSRQSATINELNRTVEQLQNNLEAMKAEVTRLEEDLGKELLFGDKLTGVIESVLGSHEVVDLEEADEEAITTACQEAIDKFTARQVDDALKKVQHKLAGIEPDLPYGDALHKTLIADLAVALDHEARIHGYGLENSNVLKRARQALVPAHLHAAHDRLYDLAIGDDGQAFKEAKKYLEQFDPILGARL